MSYLLDPERCSEPFYVDQTVAHAHIFRVCLKVLSTVEPPFPAQLYDYAATYWLEHQVRSIGSEFSTELVSTICTFFSSEGCKQWLKYTRPSFSNFPGPILHEGDIQNIGGSIILEINKWFEIGEDVPPPEILHAMGLVADPSKLLEYLGKRATQLWLYEDLPLSQIELAFRIAIWCFCMRTELEMDSLENLQSIAANDFTIIRAWLGNLPGQNVSRKNLGIACGVLRLWDQSAQYLGALDESSVTDDEILECLVVSCMESGKYYDQAIKEIASLDSRTGALGLRLKAKFLLGCAYKAKGDLDRAIAAFEASDSIIFFPVALVRLHQLYTDKGDINGVIMIYERAVAKYSGLWWIWQFLYIAYRVKEDIENSVGVYGRALDVDNDTVKEWASEGLRNGNFEKGTNTVERYNLSGIHHCNTILTSRCTRFRRRLVCLSQYDLRQPTKSVAQAFLHAYKSS